MRQCHCSTSLIFHPALMYAGQTVPLLCFQPLQTMSALLKYHSPGKKMLNSSHCHKISAPSHPCLGLFTSKRQYGQDYTQMISPTQQTGLKGVYTYSLLSILFHFWFWSSFQGTLKHSFHQILLHFFSMTQRDKSDQISPQNGIGAWLACTTSPAKQEILPELEIKLKRTVVLVIFS